VSVERRAKALLGKIWMQICNILAPIEDDQPDRPFWSQVIKKELKTF